MLLGIQYFFYMICIYNNFHVEKKESAGPERMKRKEKIRKKFLHSIQKRFSSYN